MAGRAYVGRHRQERRRPPLADRQVQAGTQLAAILAVIGTVLVVAGDGGTGATSRSEAVAARGTGGRPASTSTAVRGGVESGDMSLGKLTLHLAATRAITTIIVGDGINRRLSWRVQVSNQTGAPVTIGDPTAILWATDGSGHVAVSRQRVPSGSRQAATVSFDLPRVLEPSSITLTLDSVTTELRVESS